MIYSNDSDRASCMADFNIFLHRHKVIINGLANCFHCDGSGRVWHPDSYRDSYEGNKMRESIKCPACKGTKVGRLYEWKQEWRKEKKEYEARKKREIKEQTRRRRILQKLTKADREFLGLYYE